MAKLTEVPPKPSPPTYLLELTEEELAGLSCLIWRLPRGLVEKEPDLFIPASLALVVILAVILFGFVAAFLAR